jgi:GNAT superfamily N-acetyltransferase
MEPPLSIRPAEAGDLALIRRYVQALAAHEGCPDAAVLTESQLGGAIFGPRAVVEAYVLEFEGRGVGYAILHEQFATFSGRRRLYLEDVFIEPGARGRSLGGQFMRWLFELARARGQACVDWACVENNPRAMAFYERLGAKRKDGVVLYRYEV